ncbi:MAG: hypothetical protein K6E33_01915 [Lachnospiraceae bacterium]|nr:hypothetical protein [Lachnospiraceae bacterium]
MAPNLSDPDHVNKNDQGSSSSQKGTQFTPNGLSLYPEAGAADIIEDTGLVISGFDREPVLEKDGSVRIYENEDLIDEISFSKETATLGGDGAEKMTFNVGSQFAVALPPTKRVSGALYLRPHPGTLKTGRTYNIVITDGAVTGTVNGNKFCGISEGWSFTTRENVPEIKDRAIRVATDLFDPEGMITCCKAPSFDGDPNTTHSPADQIVPDFTTIQGALNHAQSGDNACKDFHIEIFPGTYRELLYYAGSGTIRMTGLGSHSSKDPGAVSEIGSAREKEFGNSGTPDYSKGAGCVIVEFINSTSNNPSEESRNLLNIAGGNFIIENMGFENTYSRINDPKGSQSEALGMYSSHGTFAAYNCFFKGHQDTIRIEGKSWFYNCYISGDTDFLWTEQHNRVLLIERCNLVAVYDNYRTPGSNIAYLTAPRMTITDTVGKGLVVLNSNVTVLRGAKAFFGRTPWSKGYYNQAAFINTKVTVEDGAEFVCDWSKPETEETVSLKDRENLGWKQYGTVICGDAESRTSENISAYTPASTSDDASAYAPASTPEDASAYAPASASEDASAYAPASTSEDASANAPAFSTVLTDSFVNKEYAGRDAVINRLYSVPAKIWSRDDEEYWDLNALISRMGWNCTEDVSVSG